MIVAVFILALAVVCGWCMWEDLSSLIEEQLDEIGAGGSDGLDTRPLTGATATLTATGADDFRGEAA